MPKIQLPASFERVMRSKCKFIVVIGGRGSGKSESMGRMLPMRCQTEKADILCGREYQNTIDDSVHKLIKEILEKENVSGFRITDKKIDCLTGGNFRYKGFAKNPENVKSAQGFKYSWIEEAQSLSQQSIDDLLPTIRASESQLFFTGNPGASTDPFSKRFITPYLQHLLRDGYYEDDLHLIVFMNWRDNPWHKELEPQRLWDKEHLSDAKYSHIWEGDFSDEIDDAIIKAEWFDSCVDAHLEIPFPIRGSEFVAHDPADSGDARGLVHRHGSLIKEALSNVTGDVNEACDWATDYTIAVRANHFIWDGVGIGLSLKRQINEAFNGRNITATMFMGSRSPEFPKQKYEPVEGERNSTKQKLTNLQLFKNLRSQRYWMLRDRVYNTHLAVTKRIFTPAEKMISFSSKITEIRTLRSELCRIPRKKNTADMIQIMSKEDMKKLGISSPNLSDSATMSLHTPVKLSYMASAPEPEAEAAY